MAWYCPGDKPLSEPMMVRLPTHILVTRPQWVKHPGCESATDYGMSIYWTLIYHESALSSDDPLDFLQQSHHLSPSDTDQLAILKNCNDRTSFWIIGCLNILDARNQCRVFHLLPTSVYVRCLCIYSCYECDSPVYIYTIYLYAFACSFTHTTLFLLWHMHFEVFDLRSERYFVDTYLPHSWKFYLQRTGKLW